MEWEESAEGAEVGSKESAAFIDYGEPRSAEISYQLSVIGEARCARSQKAEIRSQG